MRLPVDVLVVAGESRVRVASHVVASVPIVLATATDPIASGLAATLARPGRNVTGLTLMGLEMSAKRVELLKEAIPRLTKLAILVGTSDRPVRDNFALRETQTAARRLGMATVWVQVATATDLDGALTKVKDERAGGLVTLSTRSSPPTTNGSGCWR